MKYISSALAIIVATSGAAAADVCSDAGVSRLSFIIPYRAGGGYDTYGRALAEAIEATSSLAVTVSNVTGGGGDVGRNLILGATDADPIIGFVSSRTIVTEAVQSGTTSSGLPEGYDFLGTALYEAPVFVAQPGYELPQSGGLVIGSGVSYESSAVNTVMPLMALGIDTKIITGYDGSSEQIAAVLRGEVDLDSGSASSAVGYTESGDLAVKLTLTDKEMPQFPGVPYLAGEGGMADLRSRDLPAEERAKRMALATGTVNINTSFRLLATGTGISDSVAACLAQTVETALFSSEFADASSRSGREISPLTGAETDAAIAAAVLAQAEYQSLIEDIMRIQSGN